MRRYETEAVELFKSNYSFSVQTLMKFDENQYKKLKTTVGSVDLKDVVGTDNGNYIGRRWGEILEKGELQHPHKCLRELAENPEYYLSNDKKEGWYFACVRDRYYVNGGGNHRTLIGRAFLEFNDLPTVIHNVTIEHYEEELSAKSILDSIHTDDNEGVNPSPFIWVGFACFIAVVWLIL
ncbi:hypothetical protein MD535_23960 [Vibrio sp. ZSDZ65]|uniref:Uncharacterized protein n=1 Tax=Vibrio qingdaonensis TaxID=2829491 RepID=A0A9X3CV52_9VIBR|nr:hypothetical protein [Vibrio qingdaonensis]MCW8349050.1 hypothetical protein [Vibrio qingdaonensis]